jgi:hypothetical protein
MVFGITVVLSIGYVLWMYKIHKQEQEENRQLFRKFIQSIKG